MPERVRLVAYVAAITVATAGWLFFLYEVAEHLVSG